MTHSTTTNIPANQCLVWLIPAPEHRKGIKTVIQAGGTSTDEHHHRHHHHYRTNLEPHVFLADCSHAPPGTTQSYIKAALRSAINDTLCDTLVIKYRSSRGGITTQGTNSSKSKFSIGPSDIGITLELPEGVFALGQKFLEKLDHKLQKRNNHSSHMHLAYFDSDSPGLGDGYENGLVRLVGEDIVELHYSGHWHRNFVVGEIWIVDRTNKSVVDIVHMPHFVLWLTPSSTDLAVLESIRQAGSTGPSGAFIDFHPHVSLATGEELYHKSLSDVETALSSIMLHPIDIRYKAGSSSNNNSNSELDTTKNYITLNLHPRGDSAAAAPWLRTAFFRNLLQKQTYQPPAWYPHMSLAYSTSHEQREEFVEKLRRDYRIRLSCDHHKDVELEYGGMWYGHFTVGELWIVFWSDVHHHKCVKRIPVPSPQ